MEDQSESLGLQILEALFILSSAWGIVCPIIWLIEKYREKKSCLIKNEENLIYITDKNTECLHPENHSCQTPLNPFEDTTDIIKSIASANKEKPLKIVICTSGGGFGECEQIMRFLKSHKQGYTVYCNEAYSAGTWISITANDLVMTSFSQISKIDPVVGGKESVILDRNSNNNSTKRKKLTYNDGMALSTLHRTEKLLEKYIVQPDTVKQSIRDHLIYSNLRHASKFSREELSQIGIKSRLPTEEEEKKYFGYFQSRTG